MNRSLNTLSLLILICCGLLYSCVPQKEVAAHKKQIATIDSTLLTQKKELQKLDEKLLRKQKDNEADDTGTARIKKFIEKTNREIDSIVSKNTVMIGEVEVDRKDWNRLKKTLMLSDITSKTIREKLSLINDLINRNTVVRIDQDVLFEPGKYTVSAATASAIGRFFEPAAAEIDQFIRKYPDFPLSLVITAKGYADATTIAEGTSLYKDMVGQLKLSGKKELTNTDLNAALSNKRAMEVIELFKTFTKGKSYNGANISNIIFVFEGKGESFPNPKVNDYRIDDPRRRVVLLFWSIFPEE